MIRRTMIEIDVELLDRAKRALGEPTTRGTVEAALRHVTEQVETAGAVTAERQRHFFETIDERLDLEVLGSDEMWR